MFISDKISHNWKKYRKNGYHVAESVFRWLNHGNLLKTGKFAWIIPNNKTINKTNAIDAIIYTTTSLLPKEFAVFVNKLSTVQTLVPKESFVSTKLK